MERTVIVLGAGLGGLVASEALRKRLPASDRVIAIDQQTQHYFPPSLLWMMVGKRQPADFTRPLDRISIRGVEFIHGKITRIDPERRWVHLGDRTLTGDALIVALGAEYAPESIPGLTEAGHNFYTPEGAQGCLDALRQLRSGQSRRRIAILTASPLYKCPAAPYEAALLVDAWLRDHGMRDATEMRFYAAEPQPMPVAGPDAGTAIRGLLASRQIAYHPGSQITSVDASTQTLRFADGREDGFDLLLYVPPHRAPQVVREAGLLGENGWISVDRHTLATKYESVYAIGDITSIPLAMGRPLPKAGVFAHGQAEVVAHNIVHAWTGRGAPRRYDGHGMCFIEAGHGRAGIGRGNFYAEPTPAVDLHLPSRFWHLGKLLYEKYWLYKYF